MDKLSMCPSCLSMRNGGTGTMRIATTSVYCFCCVGGTWPTESTGWYEYDSFLVRGLCDPLGALVHLNSSAQGYSPGCPAPPLWPSRSTCMRHHLALEQVCLMPAGDLCIGETPKQSFVPISFWWLIMSVWASPAKCEKPELCGNRNYVVHKVQGSRRTVDGMIWDSSLRCPIALYSHLLQLVLHEWEDCFIPQCLPLSRGAASLKSNFWSSF